MRADRCSSIGEGILWMLFDEEGSISFLLTRKPVPIEEWLTWARNPATWRRRFPGEIVGRIPDS